MCIACTICGNARWVCEDHADKPRGGSSDGWVRATAALPECRVRCAIRPLGSGRRRWRPHTGEQALASIAEAVALRRDLAAARPDAFLPDLARSLAVLGRCCSSLGDVDRALRCAIESLNTLRNHLLRFSGVFIELAATLVSDYLEYSERLGQEPDQNLLQPYLPYLNELNSSENRE